MREMYCEVRSRVERSTKSRKKRSSSFRVYGKCNKMEVGMRALNINDSLCNVVCRCRNDDISSLCRVSEVGQG